MVQWVTKTALMTGLSTARLVLASLEIGEEERNESGFMKPAVLENLRTGRVLLLFSLCFPENLSLSQVSGKPKEEKEKTIPSGSFLSPLQHPGMGVPAPTPRRS